MRQIVFDEINSRDVKKIKDYLSQHFEESMPGLYWINLSDDLLDETQFQHKSCQPFYFVIEVGNNYVKIELLIRSRKRLRCSCIKYANEAQRNFILHFADKLIEDLNIRT